MDKLIVDFENLQKTASPPLKNQLGAPIDLLKAYRSNIVGLQTLLDPMRTSLQKIQDEKGGLVPPAQTLVNLLLITRSVSLVFRLCKQSWLSQKDLIFFSKYRMRKMDLSQVKSSPSIIWLPSHSSASWKHPGIKLSPA